MAILCVAAAAAVHGASSADPDYAVVRGRLGVPTAFGGGQVTVDQVRVGTALADSGDVHDTTPGMFVVVSVTGGASGSAPLSLTEFRLRAEHGYVYQPYGLITSVTADPGFAQRLDQVFEVDPAEITDLTLEAWQSEVVHGYQERLQVPLGITGANAAQWRAASVHQVLEPAAEPVTESLP